MYFGECDIMNVLPWYLEMLFGWVVRPMDIVAIIHTSLKKISSTHKAMVWCLFRTCIFLVFFSLGGGGNKLCCVHDIWYFVRTTSVQIFRMENTPIHSKSKSFNPSFVNKTQFCDYNAVLLDFETSRHAYENFLRIVLRCVLVYVLRHSLGRS